MSHAAAMQYAAKDTTSKERSVQQKKEAQGKRKEKEKETLERYQIIRGGSSALMNVQGIKTPRLPSLIYPCYRLFLNFIRSIDRPIAAA